MRDIEQIKEAGIKLIAYGELYDHKLFIVETEEEVEKAKKCLKEIVENSFWFDKTFLNSHAPTCEDLNMVYLN